MQWKAHNARDTRIKMKFFFVPERVDDTVYWLELRKVKEEYYQGDWDVIEVLA